VPQTLGPVVEPVLVIGGTVLGCLLLHEGLIRRHAPLRFLFGLKPRAAAAPAQHTASLAAPGAQS
jgi:glucans biosynthesis protein C